MQRNGFVVVSDRGGHLHNALMLLDQMKVSPEAFVITSGPEAEPLRARGAKVLLVPYIFTWFGKKRVWDPLKAVAQCSVSAVHAFRLRPKWVVSTGASDVVFFCYWAKLLGAKIFHVECMNQVASPSLTGKLLYPIADAVFVQWQELLESYGKKARYAGWVL